MFAAFRTLTVDVAVAAFDTFFFRRSLKKKITALQGLLGTAVAMRVRMEKDEESARAQLMQLRVHQESVEHRTGFMVSAFVPAGVIKRLNAGSPQQRLNFQMRVSKVLVEHALKGLFRVTAKGTMHAMVFEPLGDVSNKRIVSPVFETKDGEHKVIQPPANSMDIRAIQAGTPEQRSWFKP